MSRYGVVISGRGDYHPLQPVISALIESGAYVDRIYLTGLPPGGAASKASAWINGGYFDGVIILGDRYEALGAALAATYHRVPIIHIHGGEATFGSFDNQIRDAITKLATVHFVAAEPYWQRLFMMGEHPDRIFTVGAPGLDNLTDLPPREPGRYFVVTYHPETLGDTNVEPILRALERFPDRMAYWTTPNNDPGSSSILRSISTYLKDVSFNAFIGLCRHAAAVVGNSSSGIIEAPTLGVPTVNVGIRQEGRLRAPSIFDCDNEEESIFVAINAAFGYDGPFDNPYGGPGASKKIANILDDLDLKSMMIKRW